MGTVRINFHDDDGQIMFNNIMRAFVEENGYSPEHFDGHYAGKETWESELTGWLTARGYPCLAWKEMMKTPGGGVTQWKLPTGVELEESLSTFFRIAWR